MLEMLFDEVIRVEGLHTASTGESHVVGWAETGYTKLHLWSLVQFDHVVYLDADTLVLENIDEVTHACWIHPDVFMFI
jgi:alpha-N-acetylglucosamine transferase